MYLEFNNEETKVAWDIDKVCSQTKKYDDSTKVSKADGEDRQPIEFDDKATKAPKCLDSVEKKWAIDFTKFFSKMSSVHIDEIAAFSPTLFCKKFRESNDFTNKLLTE